MHDHDHPIWPKGHNHGPKDAMQWQRPHDPEGEASDPAPPRDADRDLDLVETAFRDGFAAAADPTSFLRLAGVAFEGRDQEGTALYLLRVETRQATDIGSLTPHLGGGSFRYAPLPSRMTSRRDQVAFIYFDGAAPRTLSLAEAKALAPIA